jgi:hypothetical protein
MIVVCDSWASAPADRLRRIAYNNALRTRGL